MTVHDGAVSVLIAEDDAALRRLLELLLTADGFSVRSVEDGVEALAAYEAAEPDVIVCDVMMPRMSGLTMCRTLRDAEHGSTTPVILLTARVFDEDIEDVMRLGGISFMNKPFDHEQLTSSIRLAATRDSGEEAVPGSDRLGWLRAAPARTSALTRASSDQSPR